MLPQLFLPEVELDVLHQTMHWMVARAAQNQYLLQVKYGPAGWQTYLIQLVSVTADY